MWLMAQCEMETENPFQAKITTCSTKGDVLSDLVALCDRDQRCPQIRYIASQTCQASDALHVIVNSVHTSGQFRCMRACNQTKL